MRKLSYVFCVFVAMGATACADQPVNSDEMTTGFKSSALEPGVPGEPCTENGASTACYFGPTGTKDVGMCKAGTQKCIGGFYTDCLKQVLPNTEMCDSKDNDCDGSTDEDLGHTTCGTGQCETTVANCVDGTETDCVTESYLLASIETCDGADNDCNGLVDDNQAGDPLSESCYSGPEGTSGKGECVSGTKTCANGVMGPCTGEVTPATEVCDALDNDCDDTTDEDFAGLGNTCTEGAGTCASNGTTVCNAAKDGTECSAIPGEPSTEMCDALDNDCDSMTDENASGTALTQSCYSGAAGTADKGVCKSGTQTCSNGSFGTTCPGEILPSEETCDALDNDCDEVTDEGASGATLSETCYSGTAGTQGVGQCKAGTSTCCGGSPGPCEGEVVDAVEACGNDIDDDCDGVKDTDCVISCTDTDGDGYGKGCDKGVDCDDTNATVNPAAPEWCGNSKDDDCDGLTDENQCNSTGAGSVLVVITNTGACSFDNLWLVEDVKGPGKPSAMYYEFLEFTPEKVFIPLTGGKAGLHRFNVEYDTDAMYSDGVDPLFVNGDAGFVSTADQCGTLEVYYMGVMVSYSAMLDPRPAPWPFGSANAFACFGLESGCYLCGGDWDDDGTADCTEGSAYCNANIYDKEACLP